VSFLSRDQSVCRLQEARRYHIALFRPMAMWSTKQGIFEFNPIPALELLRVLPGRKAEAGLAQNWRGQGSWGRSLAWACRSCFDRSIDRSSLTFRLQGRGLFPVSIYWAALVFIPPWLSLMYGGFSNFSVSVQSTPLKRDATPDFPRTVGGQRFRARKFSRDNKGNSLLG